MAEKDKKFIYTDTDIIRDYYKHSPLFGHYMLAQAKTSKQVKRELNKIYGLGSKK